MLNKELLLSNPPAESKQEATIKGTLRNYELVPPDYTGSFSGLIEYSCFFDPIYEQNNFKFVVKTSKDSPYVYYFCLSQVLLLNAERPSFRFSGFNPSLYHYMYEDNVVEIPLLERETVFEMKVWIEDPYAELIIKNLKISAEDGAIYHNKSIDTVLTEGFWNHVSNLATYGSIEVNITITVTENPLE